MVAETFKNFATSVIAGSTLTSGGTSFSCTGGAGSNFPSSNFLVTIDTEIIYILSRSSDTFTILSGGRGWDGTTAASHSVGATIQLCDIAYTQNHLWQNVSDSYKPDVPVTQASLSATGVPNGTAGGYDTEFESTGSWTLYPTVASGGKFDINTTMRSHLVFNRAPNDNTLYTAYLSFAPGSSFTATCKISEGINVPLNGNVNSGTIFFVSDNSNPSASLDSGNRFRIDCINSAITSGTNLATTAKYIRALSDVSGTGTQINPGMPMTPAMPVYLRIAYDGSNGWRAYVGDGWTYWYLALRSSFSLVPQSIGFQFYSNGSGSTYTQNVSVIDFLHVTVGSILPIYGT